jgi:hypothetical protein
MPHNERAQRVAPLSPENETSCTDTDTATDSATQEFFASAEQERFDWDHDPAVILHDQAAVAAYLNPIDELVVKQRDTLGQEATIFIAPENVELFLQGLSKRAAPLPIAKKLCVVDGGSTT